MRLWLFELLTGGLHDADGFRRSTAEQPPLAAPQASRTQPHFKLYPHHIAAIEPAGSYIARNLDAVPVTNHAMTEQQGSPTAASKSGSNNSGKEDQELGQDEKAKAAAMIQRNYRGYRERRQIRGMGLSASTRWSEAVKDLQWKERTRPRSKREIHSEGDERDRAKRNWKRVSIIASRAGADDDSETESDDEGEKTAEEIEEQRERRREAKAEREKTAKQMDLQYWLEMVDEKHRYGSNLRAYHQEWLSAGTNENFFYWLDHGEGKDISLPLVTRERLDSQKVRYLSREERQNYLVAVDKEGRLCWAHNGVRITTSTAFKDSVDGVVPRDDIDHPPWALPEENPGAFSSDDASSTMSTGHLSDAEATHYVNHDLKQAKGVKKLQHVSAATILNHLLRKTVKPNSWIFVADTSFRLYVGIKQSGSFQHSSFLHGSRISAAGLIKIKDGQLRRLSPLSGHYRPPTKNFRLFVHALKDAGVDMSHVSISRSYAILVGLEMYVKTRRKFKHGVQHVKDEEEKLVHPEEARKKEEAKKDKSKSAEKERRHLEKVEQETREHKRKNSLPYRVMNRIRTFGSSSSASAGKGSAKGSVGSMDRSKEKEKEKEEMKLVEAPKSVEDEDPESGIAPEGKR